VTDTDRAAERYLAAHRAFAGNGAGTAPAWLRALRERGITRFAEHGFPTTHLEEWRFTSVAPLVETPFATGGAPAHEPGRAEVASHLLPGAGRHRLVFVNGRFAPRLSATAGLPAGVTATSLATVLATEPERVREDLGRSDADARNPFAALNTAFLADGAYVRVAAGTVVEEPLELLFLATAEAAPVVAHPRTLIVVERLAGVAVVESYAGPEGAVYWTNAVTEVVAGEGARAEVYRVQRESRAAYHVATTHTRQGRDSVVRVHPLVFGGKLARHDVTAVLEGTGASCLLNGLYVVAGSQHVDHHTTIDHASPHAESHEYFNGVIDGRARGVFNGRIIVRPGAQRTDSKQTNNNLLLSEEARADSQPQLEIYADDVKCTHGATLGPIDERALFYIESRGLSRAAARAMLTYGFGAEILGRMAAPGLRAHLDGLVRARLLGAEGAAA
jgi:Fe-S cluster assembly protein SufD